MVGVVQQETVIFPAIMAEKETAIFAVPYSFMSFMLIIIAEVTAPSLFCTSRREMCLAEPFGWHTNGWPAQSFLTAIVGYKTPSQVNTKSFEVRCLVSSMLLHLYSMYEFVKLTFNRNQNIFVQFSALHSYTVVSSKLVISINTPHKLVVGCYRLCTGNFSSTSISVLPKNTCAHCRIAIISSNGNRFIILPHSDC